MMTLAEKIDRAGAIVAEMEQLDAEYKKLEADIKAAALENPEAHIALEDPDRTGRQYLAHGASLVVPVVMTADAIMKTVQKGSPAHLKIAALAFQAGVPLEQFYAEPTALEAVIEDGKAFRLRARELFGDKGPHFVAACLARKANGMPKSQVKIAWDRARELEVAK